MEFVLHLGYPDDNRYTQYKLYGNGKGKLEVDLAYFSMYRHDGQTPSTFLFLVEVKRPKFVHLDLAVQQVHLCGILLQPLFLLITDGYRLKIYRQGYADEPELVLLWEQQSCSIEIQLYLRTSEGVYSTLYTNQMECEQ